MRRRLPAGVRMYTGDDFNYAELIAGDGVGSATNQQHSDALLGIFDAIAPAASAALAALARRATSTRFHAILAPTVPLSRHIFQAPTRFYKTGIVFLAWLNGHQSHFAMVGGQQSARSLGHFAEHLPPRRRRRPDRAARARGRAHAPPARAARHRRLTRTATPPCATSRADHRWLSINTATLRGAGTLDTIIEACVRHGIRAISPWRDQVHAIGLERTAELRARRTRSSSRATAAAACSRRWTPAGRRAALDDNRRAVDEAQAARGGVPGPGRRRPARRARRRAAVEGPVRGAPRRARRHRRDARIREERRHAARDRAAASDVRRRPRLRQHDRAGARSVRRARSAAAAATPGVVIGRRRPRRRRRRLSRLVGSQARGADRARRPRARLLAFHVCDWLVPTRDLLNDRGMMGDGVIEIPRIRAWIEAAGFAGYSEVEIFSSENWWKRPADEVARDLHRAPPQRRLSRRRRRRRRRAV